MGQGPKVGLEWLWGCSQVQWLLGKWEVVTAVAGWLEQQKMRGSSLHCLPKWALFKLLPITCGVPGPDQAKSLQHPTVQAASHARSTKCCGLSENQHKLEDLEELETFASTRLWWLLFGRREKRDYSLSP